MKAVLTIVLLTLSCVAGYADELRLRDGKTIVGYYVGGDQKELWFQSNGVGANAYPTFLVESLKFGTITTFPMGYRTVPDRGQTRQPVNAGLLWRTRQRLARLYLSTIY